MFNFSNIILDFPFLGFGDLGVGNSLNLLSKVLLSISFESSSFQVGVESGPLMNLPLGKMSNRHGGLLEQFVHLLGRLAPGLDWHPTIGI